jgi:hypothetical protein
MPIRRRQSSLPRTWAGVARTARIGRSLLPLHRPDLAGLWTRGNNGRNGKWCIPLREHWSHLTAESVSAAMANGSPGEGRGFKLQGIQDPRPARSIDTTPASSNLSRRCTTVPVSDSTSLI